jgi:hypothetical protein
MLVVLWSFIGIMHVVGVVWASGIFPEAGWRRWMPELKPVEEKLKDTSGEDGLSACSS